MYRVFFFNESATTEIYTYGHTRSLHDSLPICPLGTIIETAAAGIASASDLAGRIARQGGGALIIDYGYKRSEEHTSELQSLMRISYAVFCLKKNKKYNV